MHANYNVKFILSFFLSLHGRFVILLNTIKSCDVNILSVLFFNIKKDLAINYKRT